MIKQNFDIGNYFKKHIWVFLSPLIVIILILISYAIKGIYPFGEKTVTYFDMSQLCVPIYYHISDVLHFKSNAFLNWNVANGSSLADALGSYLFFPTNIFFLFVNRDSILESMSFFLIFQLSIASLFMTLFSNRINKNKVLAIFCGVAYAACGFSLQYYTNIATFLDSMIIFPLLMLSYYRLIEENKYILYSICFALVILLNVQTTFAVCVFLLIKTGFVFV